MKAKTRADKARLAISRSIAKANRSYCKAGEAQRRVMIAKDALQQLKMHKTVATPGTYVGARTLAAEARLDGAVQLQELLHNPALKSSCNVCARGALLLSAVRYRNDCTIGPGGWTSEDSLVKEFSRAQQELIESAFESYDEGETWNEEFLSDAERRDPDKLLALILKNIVRNKGTFKITER